MRDHYRKDDATSQRRAKNTHGQVSSEKDKRKAKRAPGGMKPKMETGS